MSDDSAANNAESNPARRRPEIPEVPRKVSPAKVAGGGGLFFVVAAIIYVALHWNSWTHPNRPVPTFPSVHLPPPSIYIPSPSIHIPTSNILIPTPAR